MSLIRFNRYVDGVISGKIPCRSYIRKAVERHLADLADGRWEFDWSRAERAINFVEKMPHTKGEWASRKERITLSDWQVFHTACLFGWIDPDDGLRRFNESWVYVPRKNGKSAWTAAVAIYMLTADGEYGAEVYTGATSERQAIEVFQPAWLMCKKTPALMDRYGIKLMGSSSNPTGIYTGEGAKFERLIGDPPDGSSPHFAIIDEYHEHPDDRMYETQVTGMGARRSAILHGITTAGTSIDSPAYAKQLELESILDGTYKQDRVLATLHGVDVDDKDDDFWRTRQAQLMANPNFGVSVFEKFLESQLEKAMQSPAKAAIYKTKHLNLWVQAKSAYFNADRFRKLGKRGMDSEAFKGGCVVAFDLSQRRDMTAWTASAMVGDKVHFVSRYYLPKVALELVPEHLANRYRQWSVEGWLTLTDSESVDYGVMMDDFNEFRMQYPVDVVVYDRFNAGYILDHMKAANVPHKEYPGGYKGFNEPMKDMDARIYEGKIRHDANPVTNWQIGNVINQSRGNNVMPGKKGDHQKIDGIITMLMCLGVHLSASEYYQRKTVSYDYID